MPTDSLPTPERVLVIAAHPDEDIYFVIANPSDPGRPGKPRKEDMAGSKWAWGDSSKNRCQ